MSQGNKSQGPRVPWSTNGVWLSKELQTDLNTHGTKIDGAQFFIQLQKEDND